MPIRTPRGSLRSPIRLGSGIRARPNPVAPPVQRHLLDPSHAEPLRLREAKRQQTLAHQRRERGLPEQVTPSQWIAKIDRTTSFEGCPVPLDVVLCTPDKNPASDDAWAIMTTAEDATAAAPVDRYGLRVAIEERRRHIKCFWDIAGFKSPDQALVVNQVVFTLLTYSLLQQQFLRRGRKALNKATKSRLIEKLVPVAEHITVFTDQYYFRFTTSEYTLDGHGRAGKRPRQTPCSPHPIRLPRLARLPTV